MKLHFLGANRQVTGSRYVLEAGGLRIMIDCGLFQERKFLHRNWEPCPAPPESIDFLLLTHAHLDHCGLIPKFVREGYRGPILATAPTIELTRIVLEDAARIQEEDAAYKKKRHMREGRPRGGPHPEVPLYTLADADRALKQMREVPFDQAVRLNDRVSARYVFAGHILGSASIEVTVREDQRERVIVFSGDVGQWDSPLLKDPQLIRRADDVIMESTYGDRNHDESVPVDQALEEIINDTFKRGGNIIVPTFALERPQEILFHLNGLINAKRIPPMLVFLDSPMAVDAHTVFNTFRDELDEHTQAMLAAGDDPLEFPGLKLSRSVRSSRAINNIRGTCMIMAGSGMCTGGRVKHHLIHNIGRPESTVMFVGYQAQDTLGRHILDGDRQVRILGQMRDVRARITKINGLSAHGDRRDLLRWLGGFDPPPRRVFLTHGEERAATALAASIAAERHVEVAVPEYRTVVELV